MRMMPTNKNIANKNILFAFHERHVKLTSLLEILGHALAHLNLADYIYLLSKPTVDVKPEYYKSLDYAK